MEPVSRLVFLSFTELSDTEADAATYFLNSLLQESKTIKREEGAWGWMIP